MEKLPLVQISDFWARLFFTIWVNGLSRVIFVLSTIAHKTKNITMVEPIAGSSGMAIVIIAASLWQPLCDGLVKGTAEGIYLIM